jgi:hypothetical protein
MSQLAKALDLGNGMSLTSVEIDIIQFHESGTRVVLKSGVDVQIANKNSPEGFGDARVDKIRGKITEDDYLAAVVVGLKAKYAEA